MDGWQLGNVPVFFNGGEFHYRSAVKIQTRSVDKVFIDAQGQRFTALAGIDLEVNEGEFVSLVGPSGCGKSTLLEILAGLQQATRGEALVDGAPIDGPGPDRAVVFQDYALFPWRTVVDNVAFSFELQGMGKDERRERAGQYVAQMGMEGFENYYIWQLSGGMRQRVGLARALACEPSVLLMDEPFGALDAITRDILQDHLLGLQAETRKTVVFVTHSVDEALYLSDRVIVMGTRPGRFLTEFEVGLDRSGGREQLRALPAYGTLYRDMWAILSAELRRGGVMAGSQKATAMDVRSDDTP
jgi:NitT/TauT family transport system ATP-binding protein